MHQLTAAFIALLAATQAAAFSCGANRFQNYFAQYLVTRDCPSLLSSFDSYCRMHDSCYDAQSGKANCDARFCGCLSHVVAGTTPECGNFANGFCVAVRKFGQGAYDDAGKNRG